MSIGGFKMELRQIRYFIEVAKREHVTKAAEALHVAQSAVSRQIFNLEAELGVDLFIREGRTIRLTAIGKVFLEHMERAINVIEDAKQVIEEFTDPQRGTIHIGFPSTLATYMLPTAISAFREQYPDVKFDLNQGSYAQLSHSIIKGDINIALLAPVPPKTGKLHSSILFTENIVALLPENHHLSKRTTIHLKDLRDESFILFQKGAILREIVIDHCKQQGFTPIISFEGQDIDSIKGLVSAGLGISLVPEITLVDHLPRSTVTIPVVEPSVTRTVGMAIPTERDLLPTEKIFYEFLKDFYTRLEKFQN